MRTVNPPKEWQEQAAVIDWWAHACKRYGLPEFALYAVPNGASLAGDARRRAMQMHKLKRTGLRPGMPDLNLDVPISIPDHYKSDKDAILIPGLRIEMKRVKGGKLSPEQEAVILYLRQRGYHVVVAKGFDEAKTAIEAYLK